MTLLADVFARLDALLSPISSDAPVGHDLDGSLELHALETACLEPELTIVKDVDSSDTRDWPRIAKDCEALLEQSKDLRIAVYLARALLQIHGLAGYCAGLSFVHNLADRYWSSLYPVLEPDDEEATVRINSIQELINAPTLAQLRVAPIFAAPKSKPAVIVNDLLIATMSPLARPELANAPSHVVFSALDALGADEIAKHIQLIEETSAHIHKLTQQIREHGGGFLRLDSLSTDKAGSKGLLDSVRQSLTIEWERLTKAANPEADGADSTGLHGASGATTPNPQGQALTDITRREDIIMLIERMCGYYARVEPSSPVPLLLQRAKRLAAMDFVEIVRDLANQGLPQVGNVAGIQLD